MFLTACTSVVQTGTALVPAPAFARTYDFVKDNQTEAQLR